MLDLIQCSRRCCSSFHLLDPCNAPLTMSRWSFNSIFATIPARVEMLGEWVRLHMAGACANMVVQQVGDANLRSSRKFCFASTQREPQPNIISSYKTFEMLGKLIQTWRWMQKRIFQSASRTFVKSFFFPSWKFFLPFFIRTIVKCFSSLAFISKNPGKELRINLHCKLSL